MAPLDPHSYSDSSHPFTKHVALDLFLDFSKKMIIGTAVYTLHRAFTGEFHLDTRELQVDSAFNSAANYLKFTISKPDPIKGSLLAVSLLGDQCFSISFKTSPNASALQWLEPSQTSNGKLPYVFTQCQAIHARSIFPCQDTPAARIKYSARLDIPREMRSVMSAGFLKRLEHSDDSSVMPGRAIDVFEMEHPIPPYLFAFAVGEIVYQDIGSRSRIYAEPNMLKAAAYEFENTEEMMKQAEALFGPYDWTRFDLLVMPPSFPYGGMENPMMVFLTPTVIAGDRSGGQVVAHELAHSWTGNLITNSSANDFWLNEGFTTYAERRIIEVLDGEERVALRLGLGWNKLEEEIERFKDRPEFTKLKTNQENVDPDEIYSQVPYEKGCLFLIRLEAEYGRASFDVFLKCYIAKFRFQSIDTETFLDFLKDYYKDVTKRIDLDTWMYGTGIPGDAVKPKSVILEKVLGLVAGFGKLQKEYEEGGKSGEVFGGERWKSYLVSLEGEAKSWKGGEWQVYLESLPKVCICAALKDLEKVFGLSKSGNWEIKIGFLVLAAYSGYDECYGEIEKALLSVGRMKYLRPLYTGLLKGDKVSREMALTVFSKAKSKYHPIASGVVQNLIDKIH